MNRTIARRAFLQASAYAILAAPLAAGAQLAEQIPRIGVLRPTSADNPYTASFRQGLRDLGYVEGKTILVEYRFADGKYERLPELAGDLVRLKVDVIVTDGPGTHAAKQATKSIPIVFAVIGDAVLDGIVPSLARPGANLTGFSLIAPQVDTKRLELLKELVPKAGRMAVLTNAGRIIHQVEVAELQRAAASANVEVLRVDIRTPADFDSALSLIAQHRVGGLVVLDDALIFNERTKIADFAARRQLPAVYANKGFAEAGGLVSYGPSFEDLFRRAAVKVDRILKGAKPADLPVEQPTKFELVVNLKTAKALGLTIPQSILVRADEIIQ
jgi:putative tryptophan/tyrosine transport system substrate-binding protein